MPLATHAMSNSRQKQLAQGATHIPETHSTIIPCTQEYHLTPAVKGSDFLYHCNSTHAKVPLLTSLELIATYAMSNLRQKQLAQGATYAPFQSSTQFRLLIPLQLGPKDKINQSRAYKTR